MMNSLNYFTNLIKNLKKEFPQLDKKQGNVVEKFAAEKFVPVKIINFLFVLLLINSMTAQAQSLNDYLKTAAENNPGLRSKFLSYQASLERLPQVRALPDPEISFGIFIEPMERYAGNQVAEIQVMQMFPWFGTLGAAEDEAAAMARAKYEEFNQAKSTLFYEVKTAWFALYLLQKDIDITEENLEILKSLERIAINRLSSGETGSSPASPRRVEPGTGTQETGGGMDGMGMERESAPGLPARSRDMGGMNEMNQMGSGSGMLDVLRIQIEVNDLNNRLALLKDELIPLTTRFNNLLNRPVNDLINIPDTLTAASLPASLTEIPDSIRLNNPMMRMLQEEESAFLAQEEMNRKMGFPMIGLGLQYGIFQPRPGNESMMNGKNMIMPMATVSLPIWRSKYNAAVQEARFNRDAIVEQRYDTGNILMVSYQEALKDFNDAERRIQLFEDQTNLSQQALNILTTQYTTAGSNFEEVLRMQQQLLDYRLRNLDAVVDQNISAAMIERLMGR
jgi:outer membrane protein TolC